MSIIYARYNIYSMIDICVKAPDTDKDYIAAQMDETDPLSIYIAQIKTVLSNENAVMGAAAMIGDLEQYIYEYNFNERDLETKIRQLVNSFCSFSVDFPTKIKAKFIKGTERDVCVIDITIADQRRVQIVVK